MKKSLFLIIVLAVTFSISNASARSVHHLIPVHVYNPEPQNNPEVDKLVKKLLDAGYEIDFGRVKIELNQLTSEKITRDELAKALAVATKNSDPGKSKKASAFNSILDELSRAMLKYDPKVMGQNTNVNPTLNLQQAQQQVQQQQQNQQMQQQQQVQQQQVTNRQKRN